MPQRIRAGCDRKARPVCRAIVLCHSAFVRVATDWLAKKVKLSDLCHSAFVRVATCDVCDGGNCDCFATAHSCGLRRPCTSHALGTQSLPQRIRAGCDKNKPELNDYAGLCHSAFVRVATVPNPDDKPCALFATAHSCGLRRHGWEAAKNILDFATAHSCGLRLLRSADFSHANFLCHSAFVRVATFLFAPPFGHSVLCHSAFVRVATPPNNSSVHPF